MAIPRLSIIFCAFISLLLLAGCELHDAGEKPSPTPDDLFVIVTATAADPVDTNVTPSRPTTYIVKEGDSLIEIADQFDLTLTELQEANEIDDPDNIFAGQRLTIPTPTSK